MGLAASARAAVDAVVRQVRRRVAAWPARPVLPDVVLAPPPVLAPGPQQLHSRHHLSGWRGVGGRVENVDHQFAAHGHTRQDLRARH